jgi:hypothetical protein
MNDMLRNLSDIGVVLAAAGTPFLIAAAWKLHDSVTQLQELRSPKAVLDQITSFEALATRRQQAIAEEVAAAESKLREIRLTCEHHDYLSAVADVRQANTSANHLMFVVDSPNAEKKYRRTLAALSSVGEGERFQEGLQVLADYERLLWEQIERLTKPSNHV